MSYGSPKTFVGGMVVNEVFHIVSIVIFCELLLLLNKISLEILLWSCAS